MKTRLWFEIVAAVVIGLVVLALLGPIGGIVYGIGVTAFIADGCHRRRYHRHRHHHH